ncbi:unnamed protein product [Spirodela intermedia]|uniref:Uncharacterized protein n=1 Tax=Spirodela intermedia TaxID=51605 RepID=A0A7I8IMP1_SPIIN|nr:unnamed protein product [Spirodela intermedia]CAA6658729.1 unnamed protein product [Spirodela intermedia]
MAKHLHLHLLLAACIFLSRRRRRPEDRPWGLQIDGHHFDSLRLRQEIQPRQEDGFETKSNGMGRGTCSYTVSIKTSCSSPGSLATPSASPSATCPSICAQVYAPRLDDPASRAFERCSTDTFRISGPCGGRTCYLYLFRSGRDGWTPDSVKVYYRPGDSRSVVTFFYNVPIPSGVWYGFDLCHGSSGHTAGRQGQPEEIAMSERILRTALGMAGDGGGGGRSEYI